MKKLFKSKRVILTTISLSAITLFVTVLLVPFTLSAFVQDEDTDGFYGEVSLRSYFERGTGRPRGTLSDIDPGDPYVITRPRHLYNLSRLQGLGVFNESTFFQLGLEGLNGDTSGKPLCYLDDNSMTTVPFLDMEDSNFEYEPINAIGSEAVPFFGEFDGQGLEIKNLSVYADPEDAGLFGYTAHGSYVHDLFLTEVTINALGYTESFRNLYGPSSTAVSGTSFTYTADGGSPVTFLPGDTSTVEELGFDMTDYLAWDGIGTAPTISEVSPVISYTATNSAYKYKILISGDFLIDNGDGTVSLDLPTVYEFYRKERIESTGQIVSSSSFSLIASTTDNYGLDHSKVVLSMEFDFSLLEGSNYLLMRAHLGGEHGNNIGLIVGHCDGSVSDCYVYNGHFCMNNGSDFSDATYYSLANGSTLGLIGLVGGTVYNLAAKESDSGTSAGKDIGVLDFTTVYNEIIDSHSFDGHATFSPNGVSYVPSSSLKYRDFLRKNGSGQFVTLAENTVSFNRQKIISNTDLGIFTVATDQTGTGMNDDALNGLENSVVRKEDVSVDSNYYVYYSTGEYQKGKGVDYSRYRAALQTNTPADFYPGYHFPNYDQVTSDSFEQRDRHQNYVFRFKVDPNYRNGNGFYFSDIDKDTDGGSFVSKYFEHKLVDQNGNPIPASINSGKSGVMLRNSLGQEIRSFSANFATPDLSSGSSKMYCVANAEYEDPAANMVNFEIKTEVANVTIISGLVDNTKPAAVGIYKIDEEPRLISDGLKYIDRSYSDPDYAFFMPTDEHLAYFDYTVDNLGKGRIGTYEWDNGESKFVFSEANTHTNATQPNSYEITSYAHGEYGYATGKTRLYAHTFKLPCGRYCVGSATGNSAAGEGTAKIYYLCAQGQTDGQISFDDNAFASHDEVKDIDFVKKEAYTYNAGVVTPNIVLHDTPVTVYDASDTRIENQRLYVALTNSDKSYFKDQECNVDFTYSGGKFKVETNTLGAITYITVSNYGASKSTIISGLTNAIVKLFSLADSDDDKIFYPTT